MLEETHDGGVIVERVAALDVGKAEVVLCPGPRWGRAAVAGGPHLDDDDRVVERDE